MIRVAVQEYASIAYGWAMADAEGVCKLIADRSTGLLVGAHIVGHQASALIQSVVQGGVSVLLTSTSGTPSPFTASSML